MPFRGIETHTFDVVVVGSGISGSAAAMTAARAGARVALLEKSETFGGSAALSAGMFWTAPSIEAYLDRIPLGRLDLGSRVVKDYEEALAELRDAGLFVADELTQNVMTFGIGYSTNIHEILEWCRTEVVKAGGEARTTAAVVDLLYDTKRVTGVMTRERTGRLVRYETPAVIFATGGFQGARDELTKYIGPNADRLLLRSNHGSVGDGLRMARDAGGAGSTAMSTFYGHLIGYPIRRFEVQDYLPASQYYSGSTILVNLYGERFIDETQGDELLNQALTFQPEAKGVLIFDDYVRQTEVAIEPFPGLGVINRFDWAVEAGANYAVADTMESLLDQVASWGIDQKNLEVTINDYTRAIEEEKPSAARGIPIATSARAPQTAPYYALMVQPSITFTFGGIHTNIKGEVLDYSNCPIPGVYAAGADIGGLSNYGYAGGLAPGYITGRWAGASAAEWARKSELTTH